MSKSAKQIIVILILLLGVSVFMAVSTYNQKNIVEKSKATLEQQLFQFENERNELAKKAQSLERSVGQMDQARQQLQTELDNLNSQIGQLNSQIDRLTKDRDQWRDRMEGLRKERDELMAKLQEQPAVVEEQKPQAQAEGDASPLLGASEMHWAKVLKEKASLELELEKLNKALTDRAVRIEEFKKKNSDLELELSALKSQDEEKDHELLTKIRHNEELANNLAIELAREKNEKKVILDRLEKFKEENEGFRSEIKKLTSTKIGLEKSLAQLSNDKNALQKKLMETKGMIQNQVSDMTAIKQDVDEKLQEVEAMKTREIELDPIVINAPGTARGGSLQAARAPQGALDGSVLSVNMDNNFIIVDVGENDGVKLGDTMSVYRGDKYIASLEVIQVRKSISAADIRQQSTKIQAGDTVR